MSGIVEREADVVVIGGGIVGSAAAYYLAQRGVRVAVVERGTVHGEQSRKNWGFVRQQGRDPHEVPLMMEGNRIWRGLEQELGADLEWVQGGNLALAADPARMALFEQWLSVARQFGLDTRLLRAHDLPAVVPGLGGHWVGGMYTASDGHADPAKATDALARAAVAHGAAIHLGCAVEAIVVRDGAVSAVVTERGEIQTSWVVCAAGAWSSRLARPLGLALPQRWVRGTVASTTPALPVTACAVWGPGVAFRQRRDGSFNIAAGGALDHDVTLDSLRQIRFFLPNYWKNKSLFRFHVGRPARAEPARGAARIAGAASPARLGPRPRAPAESGEGAEEPGRAHARAAIGAPPRRRPELGRLHRRHARPDARARPRARAPRASCSPRGAAGTALPWAPWRDASSPS